MPIGLLLLAFTCLLRNLFFAGALVNFAVCALSIANRIKLEVRDEPVFPRDFALLKEVGSAMGTYDIHFPVKVITVVVAATAVLAVLGVFVRCRPFPIEKLRGWLGSLLGAAASLGVLAALILTEDAAYYLFYALSLAILFAVYYFLRNRAEVTYALVYDDLRPKEKQDGVVLVNIFQM